MAASTGKTTQWDVWVASANGATWERYTARPFGTKKEAERWAKNYIPDARSEARKR